MAHVTKDARSKRAGQPWPARDGAGVPRDEALPPEAFEQHGRWRLWFVWFQLPVLVAYGVLRGFGPVYAVIAAAGTAAVLAWRLNDDVRAEADRVNKALRESEQRFGGAFDHASHGMALVAPDGRFLQVNESLCRIVGYPREELLKKTFQDITHPDDLDADLEHVRELLDGEIETYEMEKRYFHADGHVVWILLSVSLVRDSSGAPVHFVSQIQDITQRRRIEGELRASEQRFRALTATAPVGISATDADGACVYVNEEWSELTGLTSAEARGLGWVNALHEDDRNRVYREWLEATEHGREFSAEYRYRRPDGRVVWVSSRAIEMGDADGRPAGYIGTVADITELKLAEKRMQELALRDDLTGLANRRRFHEELETHLARARRYGWGGALLYLDLDRLKAVNDTLGHAAGDQLIKQAARRLRERLRGSDFMARLGGDEFAVLIPRADADSARTVAADLVDALAAHDISIAGSSSATTSIGVALIAEPVTAEELMIRADIALYEAKAAGGNRFAFYSVETDERYTQVTP
jgi:diguanylate cyclase (GGDEF)-like protein/PAS domain S-box-containing protein